MIPTPERSVIFTKPARVAFELLCLVGVLLAIGWLGHALLSAPAALAAPTPAEDKRIERIEVKVDRIADKLGTVAEDVAALKARRGK